MKKVLGLLVLVFAVFMLVSCGEKYHDGEFTAFEVSEYDGSAQVTWVTVTVTDGKVTKYFIDELQSTITDGVFAWNEKTKKELKDEYGMTVVPGTIQVEWYLQAQAIEAKWLADGVDSVKLDDKGYINNMPAEATMVGTTYNKLAKEALAKSKKAVATAFEVSVYDGAPQVTWVDATFKNGKVTKYFIDELQSTLTDGFAWNEKTKKELKEEYGMTVVPGTIQVEWYLQAQAIEAKWLADGVDSVTLDDNGYINNMPADATMVGTTYNKLAKAAKALVK